MTYTRKPCPKCGKLMNPRAEMCKDCMSGNQRIIQHDLVSEMWLSSFAGLFMGEGTATIINADKKTYQARVSMVFRADDAGALEDIKSKLGGGIYYSDRLRDGYQTSHPQVTWVRCGMEDVDQICAWVLQYCHIPCKKLNDVLIVREFIARRREQPYRKPDWEVAAAFRARLLKCREFSSND